MCNLTIKDGAIIEKENETLEFKTASKGIPNSVWETYSSFANTFGGTIVLGIQDSGLIEGVPNTDLRVHELWNTLNNPQVISRNILCNKDIEIIDYEDKKIIVIKVPRAERYIRPIYYKNMESGTFKRNSEGDYHCSMLEIASMLRDQSTNTYDSTNLENTSFNDIDLDTLRAYRNEFKLVQPDHMWNNCNDMDFARKVGIIGHSTTMLTVAGLLMFGKEEVIISYFPKFKLDYMECPQKNTYWEYRKVTGDGLWMGNIYNFFSSVRSRIGSGIDQPLKLNANMNRIIDTDVHKAIREGLVNCLMHADYMGDLVIKIEKYPKRIVMTNSGLFRIPIKIAEKGGESDPRNNIIAKLFSLIGLSERAGVGINFIVETWGKKYGKIPIIYEDIQKQRTRIELDLYTSLKMNSIDTKIIEMITKNKKTTIDEMVKETGAPRPTIQYHLMNMKSKGVIARVGKTRGYWEIIDSHNEQTNP